MKLSQLILIPLAFVAGIAFMFFLQLFGMINVVGFSNSDVVATNASATRMTQSESAQIDTAEKKDGSGATVVSNLTGRIQSGDGQAAELDLRLNELEDQVKAATRERDGLRNDIAQLSEGVGASIEGNEFLPGANEPQGVAGERFAINNARPGGRANGAPGDFGGRFRFDRQSGTEQYETLVAAGIDPSIAADIRDRNDQWSLERLELIDQASREGWRESDEFGERMSALRDSRPDVREELGDGDYDLFLYESGQNNRVSISSIISGSAADLSGMQSGDLILSYANERIYSSRELQRATRGGTKGESVPVVLGRGGQQFNTDIPRGPLGVTLSGERVQP